MGLKYRQAYVVLWSV